MVCGGLARAFVILATATLVNSAAYAQPASSPAETAAEQPAFADMLEIHQDQWLALHLFAYNLARNRSDVEAWDRVTIDPFDMALIDGPVASAIEPLIAAYAPYAKMHPLFDNDLALMGAHILQDGVDTLPDEKVRNALIDFMPVYEATFAPRHRAVTSEMAERIRNMVDQYGHIAAMRLSGSLEADWGQDVIRFDIVPYATRAGAFTAGSWRWTVMSSLDEGMNRHAFEMVFHEASHMKPIGDGIQEVASAALAKHGIEGSRFWHYLLFYASGDAAKAALGDDYVPYIYTQGPRQRGSGKAFYDAIEATWDAHATLAARADAAAAWLAARQEDNQ